MAINDKLKFSWGHIIAFVALIVISYFSFLGLTYLTDGNFLLTGAGVILCDIILLLFFIGAQTLKGTEEKFKRKIHFERTLVFLAPFVLVAMMYPACHFWTVFENRNIIENKFTNSVKTSEQMFANYEEYANQRVSDYKDVVAKSKGTDIHKKDKVDALSLQLIDENYTKLKKDATDWADKAKGATVWNVFMIANLKTIQAAITSWKEQLVSFSEKTMSDEGSVAVFDSDSSTLDLVTRNFDSIKEEYSKKGSYSLYAIIMMILCYILMMFPYVIQQRNTKSTYHLFYNENRSRSKSSIIDEKPSKKSRKKETPVSDEDFFTLDESDTEEKKTSEQAFGDIEPESKPEPKTKETIKKDKISNKTKQIKTAQVDDDDDYESFIM